MGVKLGYMSAAPAGNSAEGKMELRDRSESRERKYNVPLVNPFHCSPVPTIRKGKVTKG